MVNWSIACGRVPVGRSDFRENRNAALVDPICRMKQDHDQNSGCHPCCNTRKTQRSSHVCTPDQVVSCFKSIMLFVVFEDATGVTSSWALTALRPRRHDDCASLRCERTRSTASIHIVKEETGKKASPTTWPNTWTTRQTTRAPKHEVTLLFVGALGARRASQVIYSAWTD